LGKQSRDPTYFAEVERVCKDSTSYDPERVKNFLLEARLPEPRPLIHVCDRHNFVEELTEYMYPDMMKYIVVYVQKVSPQKTPQVVGKLMDLGCDIDTIQNLLNSVRSMCPVEALVEQVEKRNKLRILEPWLEQRVREGSTEPATHNAIGKIYVTLNRNAEEWLQTNRFYESAVLGKFCEKLDPYLAFLCYKRANGPCDAELIRVTNANGLFKDQARYLVERQDMELWATVLTEENEHKKELVAEVVGTALPDAKDPDKVSSTVKAFMNANLPHELIGLLERLVLQKSIFSENANLQNLLLVTAIRASPDRVKDFIHRLDKFDAAEIAEIALQEENQLFEEAFLIYKKFDKHLEAISVLLQRLHSIERAKEFAERVQEPEVWSQLASAQLSDGLVAECISSYITANDATNFRAVIESANNGECYDELVKYLTMAREHLKEPLIDTEIIYALARCDRLGDLEEFISQPNVAKIQQCGDRLFDDAMFQAAKLLFSNIGNNQRLASCNLALNEFKEAVDAAKKSK
jgi:clathrin heavy chain